MDQYDNDDDKPCQHTQTEVPPEKVNCSKDHHRPEKRGRQPLDEERDEHRSSTESVNASEAVRGGETALPPLQEKSPACDGMYPNTWIGQSPQQNSTRKLRPIGNTEAQPMMPPAPQEHLQMKHSTRQIGQQPGGSSASRSPIGGMPIAASAAAAATAKATAASALPSAAISGVAFPGQVMGSITLPLLNMSPYPVPMQGILTGSTSPLRSTSPLATAGAFPWPPIGETPDTPGSGGSTGRLSGVSHDGVGVAMDHTSGAYFGSAPACCFAGVSSDGVGTTTAAAPPPLSDAFGGDACAPVGQLTLADPGFLPAVLGSAHASAQALVQQQQGLLAQSAAAAGQLAHAVQAAQQQQELGGGSSGHHIGVTADCNGALPGGGQKVQPSLQQHCQPGLAPAHARNLAPKGHLSVLYGAAHSPGRRHYMQDRHVIVRDLKPCPSEPWAARVSDGVPRSFTAVFDGHKRSESADHAVKRMHELLAKEPSVFGVVDKPSLHDEVFAAIKRTFTALDAEICEEARTSDVTDCQYGGTTALIALCIGHVLYVAHAGDSGAVMACSSFGLSFPLRLTADHKPNRPDEHARIQQAGGGIDEEKNRVVSEPKPHNNRVTLLNMSRALGDPQFKTGKECLVECTPDVRRIEMQPGDQAVILASDGLWDVLSDSAAVATLEQVKEDVGTIDDEAAGAAAAALVEESLYRGTVDNVTAVVLLLSWS